MLYDFLFFICGMGSIVGTFYDILLCSLWFLINNLKKNVKFKKWLQGALLQTYRCLPAKSCSCSYSDLFRTQHTNFFSIIGCPLKNIKIRLYFSILSLVLFVFSFFFFKMNSHYFRASYITFLFT